MVSFLKNEVLVAKIIIKDIDGMERVVVWTFRNLSDTMNGIPDYFVCL